MKDFTSRILLAGAGALLLAGCQSYDFGLGYARDQGGGCLASTAVGAAAGGVAGSAIGAGSGQIAAIAGGIALGGTIGYGINPACHRRVEVYAPVAPAPVYK
jgi:outer membrane lipoprotein SlyB